MEWDASKAIEAQRQITADRLRTAAIHLQNSVRVMISVPSRTVTQIISPRTGKARTILGPRGSNRSAPGEPPHKDYGNLRRSVTYDMDEQALVARIGSPLSYSRFLELGTRRMAARPFLRRAVAEQRERIKEILEGGQQPAIGPMAASAAGSAAVGRPGAIIARDQT